MKRMFYVLLLLYLNIHFYNCQKNPKNINSDFIIQKN